VERSQKDELGSFGWSRVEPDLVDFLDGVVRFRIRIVTDVEKHEPHIERGFAPFGRDLQHVVVTRIYSPALDLLCASYELIDESL